MRRIELDEATHSGEHARTGKSSRGIELLPEGPAVDELPPSLYEPKAADDHTGEPGET